eukprot:COSAG01_NODE_5183_length_4426_cov_5.185810_2_plen_481_part_00
MGGGEDSGSDEDCSALLGLDQMRPRSSEKVTAPPAAADDVAVAAEGPPLRAQTTSVALSRLKEQTLGIVRDADWLRHELERETGEQLAMWTSRRQRLEEIVTEMVSLQHAYLQSTQEAGEAEVAGGALPLVELRTGCEASIRSMQELFAEEAEAGSADSREAAAAAALLAAAPSAHQPWLAEQRRIRLQNASRRRAAMARASLQPQQPQPQQKSQQQKSQQPPQQKQAGGQAAAAAEVGKLQRALRHSQSEVARLRQELEQALTQDLAQLGAARRALDSSASDRKRVTAATLERVRKQLRSSTAALEHERVAHAASQRLVRETRGQLAVAQAALRDHVTSAAAIAAQTAAAAEQHGGGASEQQQQLQLLRSQLAHSQQRCAGLERKLAKQARRTRLKEGADQRVSGAGAAEQQQQQQEEEEEVEDGDEEEGGVEGGYHVLGGDDAALRIELETLRERERVGGQRRASLEAEVNRLELELE